MKHLMILLMLCAQAWGIGVGLGASNGPAETLVTDGLIHRWELSEESGSTLYDSIGEAHLTAYTGVAAYFDSSMYAQTDSAIFDEWLSDETQFCVGGIFRSDTLASDSYIIGGSSSLQDHFWLYQRNSGLLYIRLRTSLLSEAGGDSAAYVIASGPDLDFAEWTELHLQVDLDADAITSYHRQHLDDDPNWADSSWTVTDWTVSSGSIEAATGIIRDSGTGGTARIGKRSTDPWSGWMSMLYVAAGAPDTSNVFRLLAQPTKSLAKFALGTSAACWLFDAGSGQTVHELVEDGWANSVTFDSWPTWDADLTGIPQAGFRCGARRGGKPGLLLGTADGTRLLAHAKAAVYSLADAEDANEISPYTIEVVCQSGFSETDTSHYSMIFGCMAADVATVGKWFQYRGHPTIRNTLFRGFADYGTTASQTMYAGTGGSNDVIQMGVFTHTLRTQGNVGGTPNYMIQHHESEVVPAVDVSATNHGRQVDTATANAGGANNSSATYYTVMGNAPTETGSDRPQYADLIIREVRIYDDCLSDAQLLQNRTADRLRNGGRVWYVDAAAKFNGWGTPEAPFDNVQNAVQRMHNGDTIYIVGEIELTRDGTTACISNGASTARQDFIGGYRNITVTGDSEAMITRGRLYDYRTGDAGYGSTVLPDGVAVPHINDVSTLWTITANQYVPMENWNIKDITFNCADLAEHAFVANAGASGYGNRIKFERVTVTDTHDWMTEHTGEGLQSGWQNFKVYDCVGTGNRSQLVYVANGAIAGDISGFVCTGNVSYAANNAVYSHYEPTTDAALPDPPTGIGFITNDTSGSAIVQIWLGVGAMAVNPVIGNNFIYGPGASAIIAGTCDGGLIYNNVIVFDQTNAGYGIRVGGDTKESTGVLVYNNTIVNGLRGIIYYGDSLTFTNNVIVSAGSDDIYDDETDAAGPLTHTCTYNVGTNDDLGEGTGNIPASTNIILVDDEATERAGFALTSGSDGYRSGLNATTVHPRLKTDAVGVSRGSSWSMGAVQ